MVNAPGSPAPRSAGANSAWPVFRSLDSYSPRFLSRDVVAGLTLAAIAIPEQMATARLGGFSPEIGFFAFLAGSLAFAFFGNNRFLSCGANSTITPILAGGLTLLAASGSHGQGCRNSCYRDMLAWSKRPGVWPYQASRARPRS